ncbi:MAG: hypothetical protein AAGI53_02390 [Planctomycetota bacterium]
MMRPQAVPDGTYQFIHYATGGNSLSGRFRYSTTDSYDLPSLACGHPRHYVPNIQ